MFISAPPTKEGGRSLSGCPHPYYIEWRANSMKVTMDKDFFKQFTLEQLLAISEIVEAMLDSQEASPCSQE